jgi:hypothetical protein
MNVSLIDGHIDDDVQMTDEQIVKALEICLTSSVKECPDCPYYRIRPCISTVTQDAINLINRQKAEIEDLNKSRNGLLRKCVSAYHEGYKYFADKLCEDRVSNDPVVIAVRSALKEMVGDSHGD